MYTLKNIPEWCRRTDFIIEGLCCTIDGIVLALSIGYIKVGLQLWWLDKIIDLQIKRLNVDV